MRRFFTIFASLLFWAGVVFYLVWSSGIGRQRRNGVVVGELNITVSDSARLGLVTSRMVGEWIAAEGLHPVGKRIGEVDAGELRRAVMGKGSVADAVVYVDMEGKVNITLTQHTPVARVIAGGYDFFILQGGHILPRQGYAPQYIPVVTGNFGIPFGKEFAGDVHLYAAEREKKSDKNYIFLCKLITFAEYIGSSDFWRAQIVQISVSGGSGQQAGSAEGVPAARFYHEPEVELIPRAGDHVIVLGSLDGYREKLDNLMLFYRQAAAAEGWNKWSRIILKYDNQIVCK